MNSSTKWFLIIVGGLFFIGLCGLFLISVVFLSVTDRDAEETVGRGEKIGLIELKGEIVSSEEIVRQFKKYREDSAIKGILLRVDSPGGGVVASQEIYEEVRKTRDAGKTVVVSMGSLAASGGYYVACGASRIVANPGTLTGSIGVISQFIHVDSLLGKIGVAVSTFKSGKFKDAGSPFRRLSSEDQQYFQGLMNNVYHQFVAVVERERKLDHDSALIFSDGRVFSGEEAYQMKLVDTLGTYEDAVMITAHMSGIQHTPAIVKERKRTPSLIERVVGVAPIPSLQAIKEELMEHPILQYRMATGF